MRVVGPPHESVDAVDVATTDLLVRHRGRSYEHVGPDVLGGQAGKQTLHPGPHFLDLPRCAEVDVGLPENVPQPERSAFHHCVLEPWEPVELAREQQLPEDAVGPERNLTDVHGYVVAVGVVVGLPGMGVDHETSLRAGRPHPVVMVRSVGREVVPHGRHHHSLDAGLVGQGLDLGYR